MSSVKTKLYMKKAGTSDPFRFVAGVENLKLLALSGRFEEVIEMGGDGRVKKKPTGITEIKGGEIGLYWNIEWRPSEINSEHRALLDAVFSQELKEMRIIFSSGWIWNFLAYIQEFAGDVPKEKNERATIKLEPEGTLIY